MSSPQRLGLLVAAVAVIVIGFVIAQSAGTDDETAVSTSPTFTSPAASAPDATTSTPAASTPTTTTPEPEETEIKVVDGKPQGGLADITVKKGDRVRFEVDADVTDHIHVHGYDLMKDISPDEDAEFSFPASIEGKFEIELEDRGEQIAELTVEP